MSFNPEQYVQELGFMPGEKVADLVAGVGHMAFALRKTVTDTGRVYAVDISEAPLAKIKNEAMRNGFENLDVIMGDVEEERGTKLKDALVNGAVFGGGLSKIRDKTAALREVRRILRQGGRLAILEWKRKESEPDVYKQLCAEVGFMFEKEFEAGEDHYGLLFKKSLE